MHYYALVEIPEDAADIDAAVAAAMEPHREDEETLEGIWDWYSIGGRMTGRLDGYNPTTDRRNMEHCWLCNGAGQRPDNLIVGCNGCESTGIAIKFASKWARHEGDIQRRRDLTDEVAPFTLVTGGKAYSKEHWNGNYFEDTTGALLEAWAAVDPNARLVVVDYHC